MDELYKYIINFFKAFAKDNNAFSSAGSGFYSLENYDRIVLSLFEGSIVSAVAVDGLETKYEVYNDKATKEIRQDFSTYFYAYYAAVNGYNVGISTAELGLEFLLQQKPIFQRFVTYLDLTPTLQIPTAGVRHSIDPSDEKIYMLYNPAFFLEQLCLDLFVKYGTDHYSIDEDTIERAIYHTVSFILAHEFMHIINAHTQVESGLPPNRIANIVHDYEINNQLDTFLGQYSPLLKIEGVGNGFQFKLPAQVLPFALGIKKFNTLLGDDLEEAYKKGLKSYKSFKPDILYFSFTYYLAITTTADKYEFLTKLDEVCQEIDGTSLDVTGRLPDLQQKNNPLTLYNVGDEITCPNNVSFGGIVSSVTTDVLVRGNMVPISSLKKDSPALANIQYGLDYKGKSDIKVTGSSIMGKGYKITYGRYNRCMCSLGYIFYTISEPSKTGDYLVEGFYKDGTNLVKTKVSVYQLQEYDNQVLELKDSISIVGVGLGVVHSLDLDNGYIDVELSDNTINTIDVFGVSIIKKHISRKYKIGDVLTDIKNNKTVKVVGLPTFDNPEYQVEEVEAKK